MWQHMMMAYKNHSRKKNLNINIHSLVGSTACTINENRAIKNYEQYVLYDFIYINNKTVTILYKRERVEKKKNW